MIPPPRDETSIKKKEEVKAAPSKKVQPAEEAEPVVEKDDAEKEVFPESTFELYDFKTLLVNSKNKEEALQTLWK